ncbi:MAG: DUF6883 domain-containing protein [Pyrinomonadaceae bacterium]
MRVPNADKAFIDMRKLAEYSLDPTHNVGKNKAMVFAKVLGLTQSDASELAEALMLAITNLEAEPGKLDRFGQRYVIDFEMARESRSAMIRSVWIVDNGQDHPRLVTCFVL